MIHNFCSFCTNSVSLQTCSEMSSSTNHSTLGDLHHTHSPVSCLILTKFYRYLDSWSSSKGFKGRGFKWMRLFWIKECLLHVPSWPAGCSNIQLVRTASHRAYQWRVTTNQFYHRLTDITKSSVPTAPHNETLLKVLLYSNITHMSNILTTWNWRENEKSQPLHS